MMKYEKNDSCILALFVALSYEYDGFLADW